jgi:inhibitor of KinA sporulation pathway (predicted exonuclease)
LHRTHRHHAGNGRSGSIFSACIRAFHGLGRRFEDAFLFAWGHYDKKQLIIDCRRHEIQYTLPAGFLDFKGLFYKKQKLLKRSGLESTLQQVGLRFEGRPHGALADARNTARLWRFVSEEGKKIHQKN